ncbi:methyltransferase, TIGR04325 family [Nitratireductor pacificus]|uniref:Methyltransferase, TIGR04325 family protein n=1 Tax=Nitratireductor pacificus pht-3B TaxID=391937 RepID=K2MCD7_9HYPH|nr:methyltransferase, TIGR04325 family [Nitratireductor pacificus]EKF18450.1 hypothetical protein NA2_12423 [Nitratireductor pacificus pht-3B]
MRDQLRPLKRRLSASLRSSLLPLQIAQGRLRGLSPVPCRFSGAYPSHEVALAAARRSGLAGYDHPEVAEVAFEAMCRIAPWDYPVLFWLRRLQGEVTSLVDAGGHMGTKYRAFRDALPIAETFPWTVYDLPAIVDAGRRRAEADGLHGLRFVDRLEEAGAPDLFLGSGLLQYLDAPLPALIARLKAPPPHLLLNKVALRRGPTVVTLECIGSARVPYQIRNEDTFLASVEALGYQMIDRWSIPSLSHVIDTHPELGSSESAGFYFRRA